MANGALGGNSAKTTRRGQGVQNVVIYICGLARRVTPSWQGVEGRAVCRSQEVDTK